MMEFFLPPSIYPFLTTKPPLSFLAFLILGIILFIRKNKYLKTGKNEEQYHEYLKTNANSLSISIRMAIVFAAVALIDNFLIDILPGLITAAKGLPREVSPYYMRALFNCGFGDSVVNKEKTMSQKIRIKLKSYDHKLVDKSAEKIVKAVKATGAIISGPIPLPTHKRIYTVNRSTFVNKKAREQFQLSDYKRLIDIYSSTAKTVDALMKLELPSGVEVEIKV